MTDGPVSEAVLSAAVGDKLPELHIPLTTSLIVSTAIASRDYAPVHHDKDHTQRNGSRDVFMNILTSNGLVGRYVTDWAGPNAVLKQIAIRLYSQNFPGDVMTFSGEVTARDEASGEVELAIVGSNSTADHVRGTVIVLPGLGRP